MLQNPNSHDERHEEPPFPNDEHDSGLSLLSLDKHPFYLRLLQRDNSSRGFSSRRRLTPASLVPFLWESSPGLPKPNWLNLNSDHHDTANYSLAPPPIMERHHTICSFASARQDGGSIELRSADDSWLSSQIKTAFRRRSRRTASMTSMLLMGSSSSPSAVGSSIHGGRDNIQSPRNALDMEGPLGSSSSSSDSEHYHVSGSVKNLREYNQRGHFRTSKSFANNSIVQLSSKLNRRITSSKLKSCCCFHIHDREL
ncbi:hypothetical protein GOP47_0000553 [Adiantum capillus-veneris]|uniref:Uncharacterized protein n=1 Tax=Adiantum capillus-veneris TaxID=13818 RepID=A0A9D4ZQM9_ADICA|nr:hypothetical protein GOP47_0000553 [Adiantum capillus-veneris]